METTQYWELGFVPSVPVLSAAEAADHRQRLEGAEAELGPLHYGDKIHTLLPSAYELATNPALLDVAEQCIGPDILLYNTNFIIKEPGSGSHVTWHQDLAYWALEDSDAQVSAWLALSPATIESGCLQMMAGSHGLGPIDHQTSDDQSNVLLQGQHIVDLDATRATSCELEPGQASFHHGWTVHGSGPNRSDDRRIGLNIQYLAPHNRPDGPIAQSARLVRGQDRHHHFEIDPMPEATLGPSAISQWKARDARMKQWFVGR